MRKHKCVNINKYALVSPHKSHIIIYLYKLHNVTYILATKNWRYNFDPKIYVGVISTKKKD